MIISRGTLANLGVGFNAKFKGALLASVAASMYPGIAMEVESTTGKNEYGWLNALPSVRKWIGDRVLNRMAASAYSIVNDDYEVTIAVKKNDVQDDNLGIYGTMFQEMGNSTNRHYDQLSFDQLKNGFTRTCYDGQYFFDTDHPILDVNGAPTTFANTDGGSGTPWFLVALDTVIKPVILQKRQDFNFVSKDAPNDDGVFFQKEFVYGADARHAVGYGLPQLAWGSKQTLDQAHFETALAALQAMKADNGQSLGLTKFALYVPPSLRSAGMAVVGVQFQAGGGNNPNWQAATLNVAPWLA